MIELLLAAALHFADPCDIVQEWRTDVATCAVSTAPTVTAGGVTLSNPVFALNDNTSANNYGLGGSVHFDLKPLATAGYYAYGTRGVCINPDGSLIGSTEVGAAADMFPPDHYRTETRLAQDDGYVVGFNTDPCLAPKTRGAVVFLAYSAENPAGDVLAGGFDSYVRTLHGVTSKGVAIDLTYEILSAPNYHQAGTLTYRVTLSTGTVGGSGSTWCTNVGSAVSSAWDPFSGAANLCGTNSTFFGGSWGGPQASVTRSVSVPAAASGVWTWGGAGAFTGYQSLTYRLPGSPGAFPAPSGVGMDGKAFVVRSSTLDAVPFVPVEQDFQAPEWVCSTWSCVSEMCNSYGVADLVPWFKCLFVPEGFDMGELVQSVKDGFTGWGPYQLIEYANGVLLSLGYAIGLKDGQCGTLFDLGPSMYGTAYSSCSTPTPAIIHTVGQAGIYIGALLALARVLAYFVQTGKVLGYFGVSKGSE